MGSKLHLVCLSLVYTWQFQCVEETEFFFEGGSTTVLSQRKNKKAAVSPPANYTAGGSTCNGRSGAKDTTHNSANTGAKGWKCAVCQDGQGNCVCRDCKQQGWVKPPGNSKPSGAQTKRPLRPAAWDAPIFTAEGVGAHVAMARHVGTCDLEPPCM